jgi:hypothetical protein
MSLLDAWLHSLRTAFARAENVKKVQAVIVPLSTPFNQLAKASALKIEKMQCSVYLFGRINISNAAPRSPFYLALTLRLQ